MKANCPAFLGWCMCLMLLKGHGMSIMKVKIENHLGATAACAAVAPGSGKLFCRQRERGWCLSDQQFLTLQTSALRQIHGALKLNFPDFSSKVCTLVYKLEALSAQLQNLDGERVYALPRSMNSMNLEQ
eukprot:1137918-Pelagomonas_calceolata.AAC.6